MDASSYIIGAAVTGLVSILTTMVNAKAENQRIKIKNNFKMQQEKSIKRTNSLEHSLYKLYALLYMYFYLIEQNTKSVARILNETQINKESGNNSFNNLSLKIHQTNLNDLNQKIVSTISEHFGYIKISDEESILAYLSLVDISKKITLEDLTPKQIEAYSKFYQNIVEKLENLRIQISISCFELKNELGLEDFEKISDRINTIFTEKKPAEKQKGK